MSTRAERWRGAGFQKGCIRPLRPRKSSKFKARARLLPQQHFRITFGSTQTVWHDGHRRHGGFRFSQIYGLDVVVIPTNVPMVREDANDLIFLSMEEKFEAILNDIIEIRDKGAPVLVGTASIDTSEILSNYLSKKKISHEVLNAKFHAKEAQIIAQAGRPGAVTIATNMAGRGTDIVLGGKWAAEVEALGNPSQEKIDEIKVQWQQRHEKVLAAGGLHIIGTERHESRRIDNQLRGRAGRQGDPGYSRFYLSMEDNLLRIFASEGVKNFMRKLGMEHGEAIEHGMVTRSIEKAQRKVEGRNFDIRKQLLEYDNVANDQRTIIYRQETNSWPAMTSLTAQEMREEVVSGLVDEYIPPRAYQSSGTFQPGTAVKTEFNTSQPIQQWLDEDDQLYEDQLKHKLVGILEQEYELKSAAVGENMRLFEKQISLQILDGLWKEHLATMDHLRQGFFCEVMAGKTAARI